jgi:hypothetical protein
MKYIPTLSLSKARDPYRYKADRGLPIPARSGAHVAPPLSAVGFPITAMTAIPTIT